MIRGQEAGGVNGVNSSPRLSVLFVDMLVLVGLVAVRMRVLG